MTIDHIGRRTVGAAFLDRVAQHPDAVALTFYRGSTETEHPSLTYAELARRARWRADALAARFHPGERVLIALPTSPEYVEIFLACLLAGLVAVPTPPLGASASAAERVAGIAGDCAPAVIFSTAADLDALVERLQAQGCGHVPVEEPGDVGPGDPPAVRPARTVTTDMLALLQYSSGSTGSPKGVMLDHGNVLANIGVLHDFGGLGAPGDVFANWMPLHHDFALFAELAVALLHGNHCVLMPPLAFARRPVEWLRMMHEFRSTVTAAPNFAFNLCLRLIKDEHLDGLDLSAMRHFMNGSEPIHAPTVAAFAKRFARVGLRPEIYSSAYGMAETTAFASGTPRDQPQTVLVVDRHEAESAETPSLVRTTGGANKEIVGVGTPGGHELRIVDPATGTPLPGAAIGEVWLRGASVGPGYWGKPELSDEVFRARLAGEDAGAPGWLRTGDLGAVVDGELFITGRRKEMMIVQGRNLYPQDVEQYARLAHPALDGFVGSAFGVDAPDERIVLIHEVDPRLAAADLPAVANDVLRHLTASFGAPVRNLLLVRRGTVRRTTSGKIERQGMRERFLTGQVPALHTVLDPDVRRVLAAAPQ